MSIDWDAEVLAPVMGVFGEDKRVGIPIYTPRGLPAFELADAVFDAEYEQVIIDPSDGSQSTTRRPMLGVRLSLFLHREPMQNDTVKIPRVGTTFIVKDVEPDGHGWAKLMLMATS